MAFYGPAEGRCVGFCALALGRTDAPELAMTPLDAQNLFQEVRWGSADCLALKCSSQGLVYFINIFYRFDGGRTAGRWIIPKAVLPDS